MSEWRPIETAPKDGTPLLLWLGKPPRDRDYSVMGLCDHHAIGFWLHGVWKSIEMRDCGSMGGEYTGWMEDMVGLDLDPTHWMPLPEPPSAVQRCAEHGVIYPAGGRCGPCAEREAGR